MIPTGSRQSVHDPGVTRRSHGDAGTGVLITTVGNGNEQKLERVQISVARLDGYVDILTLRVATLAYLSNKIPYQGGWRMEDGGWRLQARG